VILSKFLFGLGNQAGLAAFELVNMHATAWNFIEFPVDCFATFVGSPRASVCLTHDATHAFAEDCLAHGWAECNVSLQVQLEKLIKCAVAESSMLQ
jgi:hypothetical protein